MTCFTRHGRYAFRFVLITSILILFCNTFSVISSPSEAQARERAISRTTITAVIPYDYPPTSFQDPITHNAAGFAVDIMDEIALRAGLEVSYRFEHDWTAIVNAVRTGKADLAPGMGITDERQKLLAFTLPIDTAPVSLFVRSDDNSIVGLRQGITVGVIKGSAAYEIIKKKHDGISFKTFDSFGDGLFDLLAGHIDIFCCPAPTLMQLARDAGVEDRIKIVGAPLMELKRGMAMRKDDTELFAKLNAIMDAFVRTPEYQQIYTKWYGKPKPFMAVSKKMLLGAILIILVIGAMALWRYISIAGLNRKLQQEISERARVEDTLREKNTMLQTLINAIPDQVFFKDSTGRYVLVNKTMEETLGIGQEVFVGKTDDDISPPDVAEKCKQSDRDAINKGGPVFSEEHYTNKDGEIRFLDVVKAPIFDDKGGYKGLVVVSRDITGRRKVEEALRERDELLQQAVRVSQIGIFDHDQRSETIYWSPTLRTIYGWGPDEPTALQAFLDLVHTDDRESVAASVRRAHDPAGDGIWDVEHRIVRRDGAVRWLKERSQTFFEGEDSVRCPVRTVGAVLDITERKLDEEKVRQSEIKYRDLFESSADGIFIINLEGNFIDVNTTAYTRLGYTREEMLALHISKLDDPASAPLVPERMKRIHEHGFAVFESVLLRKNGAAMPVEVNSRLMEYEGRTVFFSVVRDITERKRAEEALRESEKRYHILFDQSPDGVLLIDAAGKILEFNDSAHRQLGYSREEFAQLRLSDLDPVETAEEIHGKIGKILEAGKAEFDVRHRTKQGEIRDVYIINQSMMLTGRPVVYTIWHDVTERKKAEERTLRSLREKEVLLKEIHHRVKNNMQVIYSLLNLQAKGIADTTVRAMFEESRDRVSSMALIHEKLYKSEDLAHIDFKEYLRSLVGSIAKTYQRHDVAYDLDMDQIVLDINVGIPCGLIVNELVSNSLKYAFPEGRAGTIRLGISRNSEGSHVLTVADNGIGFPPEVDFRNTLSLGLKLVNVLTGQIRGTIVLSQEQGTRFDITFPGNVIEQENIHG